MMNRKELLIVIDPGHGGWDNGASWEGRLEKDDNLRLGLAVGDQLAFMGIPVLMTRDTDVFVTLADRATMANEAGADLFVSLHRNSYPEQTPSAMGVENFIYLTAPKYPTEAAARSVLDRVVSAGVQADRGVSRGDYYVLRKTTMPAMLLEMGFINNDEDNRLFDEKLTDYAIAIAEGIAAHFGVLDNPGCPNALVMQAQLLLNTGFGTDIPLSGVHSANDLPNVIVALQTALNADFDAKLKVDGLLGPKTLAALEKLPGKGRGAIIYWLQLALMLSGHSPGKPDGVFGPHTQAAVAAFQTESGLPPSGLPDAQTALKLLGN